MFCCARRRPELELDAVPAEVCLSLADCGANGGGLGGVEGGLGGGDGGGLGGGVGGGGGVKGVPIGALGGYCGDGGGGAGSAALEGWESRRRPWRNSSLFRQYFGQVA